jgi:predicted nucleic acid-binding protein
MHYILDACAIISICNDEPEADAAGVNDAQSVVESIIAGPITIIETISYPVMYEAGRFKTTYSMSLADAVMCATARELGAALVTKDDEIKMAEDAGEFQVLWLK